MHHEHREKTNRQTVTSNSCVMSYKKKGVTVQNNREKGIERKEEKLPWTKDPDDDERERADTKKQSKHEAGITRGMQETVMLFFASKVMSHLLSFVWVEGGEGKFFHRNKTRDPPSPPSTHIDLLMFSKTWITVLSHAFRFIVFLLSLFFVRVFSSRDFSRRWFFSSFLLSFFAFGWLISSEWETEEKRQERSKTLARA